MQEVGDFRCKNINNLYNRQIIEQKKIKETKKNVEIYVKLLPLILIGGGKILVFKLLQNYSHLLHRSGKFFTRKCRKNGQAEAENNNRREK